MFHHIVSSRPTWAAETPSTYKQIVSRANWDIAGWLSALLCGAWRERDQEAGRAGAAMQLSRLFGNIRHQCTLKLVPNWGVFS